VVVVRHVAASFDNERGPRRVEGDVMSMKSKAFVKLAKSKPHWLMVPFVPFGLVVSSFVMSLLALRRTRRLWQRMG
jgi:hypothetical protein